MNLPSLSIMQSATLAGAEASHNLAAVLRAGSISFWNRPVAEVLAELNADLATTAETLELNVQAGTAVNALLDQVDDKRFPTRAPLSVPPTYSFDGSAWIYTAPPANEIPGPDQPAEE